MPNILSGLIWERFNAGSHILSCCGTRSWLSKREKWILLCPRFYGWHHGLTPAPAPNPCTNKYAGTSGTRIPEKWERQRTMDKNTGDKKCSAVSEIALQKETRGWEQERFVFWGQKINAAAPWLEPLTFQAGTRLCSRFRVTLQTLPAAQPLLTSPCPGNATHYWNSEGRWQITCIPSCPGSAFVSRIKYSVVKLFFRCIVPHRNIETRGF